MLADRSMIFDSFQESRSILLVLVVPPVETEMCSVEVQEVLGQLVQDQDQFFRLGVQRAGSTAFKISLSWFTV